MMQQQALLRTCHEHPQADKVGMLRVLRVLQLRHGFGQIQPRNALITLDARESSMPLVTCFTADVAGDVAADIDQTTL